jgi:hypothetical protein
MNLFDLTRYLLVLGFSLKVIQYTNDLTVFKSPRAEKRKKLKQIGIGGIFTGALLVVVAVLFPTIKDEFLAIKGAGSDIITIGFSCIFQYVSNTQKKQVFLSKSAWGVIIVGFIIGVVGVLTYKPPV